MTRSDALPLLFVGAPLLFVGALVWAAETHPIIPEPCFTSDAERERIRDIMFDAIDQGFKHHMTQLFEVQLRDHNRTGRAHRGVNLAVSTYNVAYDYISKWNPPPCNPENK